MMNHLRRLPLHRWLCILLLTPALALAACSSIPVTGPVQAGSAVVQPDEGSIEFLPASPVDGANQESILRGFLDAATSSANNYEIARKYLTKEASSNWQPSASVLLDDGSRVVTRNTENSYSATFTSTAAVDAVGRLTLFDSETEVTTVYSFAKVKDQWRLSEVPPGIVLTRVTFPQVFATHPLFYLDATGTELVPDVRWFASGASLSTLVVRALLAGPSSWLSDPGAVWSAFPDNTTLMADAVPVQQSVAQVNVSFPEGTAAPDTAAMYRQLGASLGTVSSVSRVALSINGTAQPAQGSDNVARLVTSSIDTRPYVLREGSVGFVGPAGISPNEVFSKQIDGMTPTVMSLSASGSLLSVGTDQGLTLLRDIGQPLKLNSSAGIIATAIDPQNFIWSVENLLRHAVTAYTPSGEAHPVNVDELDGLTLVDLRISPDGSRAVLLTTENGSTRVDVAGISRDENGTPLGLGALHTVATPVGSPVSVSWAGLTSVAYVSVGGDGKTHVASHVVGGFEQSVPSAPEITRIVGANNPQQLSVLSSDGTLRTLRSGSSWTTLSSQISVLGVAG